MHNEKTLKVLVADDTDTDRLILETIVRKEGHQVVSARNGIEAVSVFEEERPDIVLLDALMPELDGFGAARQIKTLAGEQLVPIIFLTSLSDTASLVQCLDAGGDDFLSKPYNRVILQAKIKAFNRMREMHGTMLEQRDQIVLHNEHLLQEQMVAKQVFDNIAHSGCLDANNVKHFLSPLAVFNGDILLAAMRPSGSMMVLLGDFTGHGLPAAIGAMPLASTFYGMTHKGFAMTDILREINKKLKSILPVGVFCCATMIDMNFHKGTMRVWNGGLPECFLYRAKSGETERVKSTHLPLGVLDNKNFKDDFLRFELANDDRFYIWSDGIHEARNFDGDMYGEARLAQVFADNNHAEEMFDEILSSVQTFIGNGEKDDDLSLIEIRMDTPENIHSHAVDFNADKGTGLIEWALQFEVKPASFRFFDPLPLLLNILIEVPGLSRHSGELYTILSELYNNALEHGVLGLDSALKQSPDGFSEYYDLRQQRIKKVHEGFIRFCLDHKTSDHGGSLIIKVCDSGEGFDYSNKIQSALKVEGYSGRGIPLLLKMCKNLEYLNSGSEVHVVFEWSEE